MSVMPLTTEGPNPTVVTNTDDFRFDGHAILIRELDPDQLSVQNDAGNASYDLRVGDQYRDHRDDGGKPIAEHGEIKLLPGTAVIIQTMEDVRFPKGTFGQIVPKVTLLQIGISNTPSKVDPGYNGRLLITTFNHGKRTVKLKRGQRFCSLFILRVEDGVRPYDKPSKQIKGIAGRHIVLWILDQLEARSGAVMSIVIIVTIINILVQW